MPFTAGEAVNGCAGAGDEAALFVGNRIARRGPHSIMEGRSQLASHAMRWRSWEAPVPVFANPDDVVFWLQRQPRDVAVVFAARAALRVIPLIVRRFRLGGKDENVARRRAALRAFRSVQAAWAVVAYPGQATGVRARRRHGGPSA
jgi:hypothetical protein